jgi:ABC-type branched-subunit amino acid transport system ATPase component
LSYGQQKLVAMARAIMNDGQCLLLDEPMAGVSGQIFDRIKQVIREQRDAGKAILLVEHNISFVKVVSNRVIFMASGTILAQGPLDEMLSNPQLTNLYFGVTSAAPA